MLTFINGNNNYMAFFVVTIKKELNERITEYYQCVFLKMLCESVIPKAEPIITSVGQCLKS